jgi:hypothetical protein
MSARPRSAMLCRSSPKKEEFTAHATIVDRSHKIVSPGEFHKSS